MTSIYKNKCINSLENFFNNNNWKPLDFQIKAWDSYLKGENGIIQVPTGCGKTYAALMGPLLKLKEKENINGINILIITPLKALTRDLEKSILNATYYFDKNISVGIRNGDTSNYEKRKQLINPPNILITTPESLSLLIATKKSKLIFKNLFSIIVDEWHELMCSKRGNQCELSLSWLRGNSKNAQIWAMSATIGNIEEAGKALTGIESEPPKIIRSNLIKKIIIESIIPPNMGTFPWSGHLGLRSYKSLLDKIDINKSTLLFTNTRNQAERWFQCLRYFHPEMEGKIAIHHGSLDKEERKIVEEGVKRGFIKWVICTSSLDLGVDFQPVEQIVQIGSAKNIGRLIQRAGRSAHNPSGSSKILFMPTNALELLEVSAMKRIIDKEITEEIHLPELSFDVLLQHLITLACGPGFDPDIEKKRIKNCWSYRNLKDSDWQWCLDFLEFGGKCLKAYPKYKKIEKEYDKKKNKFTYLIKNKSIISIHKFNIGTITSDKFVHVKYLKGKNLGNIEENFASKLKKGDTFFFSGRILEFLKMRDTTIYVKRSSKNSSLVPSWIGGQLAISDLLSKSLRKEISICNDKYKSNKFENKELSSLVPIIKRQNELSGIPEENELLIEIYSTKNSQNLFVYTFEGKFVNEAIGFLWALRFATLSTGTFNIASNDFGFGLTCEKNYNFDIVSDNLSYFLNTENLEDDLQNAINFSQLSKKKFKTIAQISGLVNNNTPTKVKTAYQLQISSNLLFDVFTKYESGHLLIEQANREVKREQLERDRVATCLKRMASLKLVLNHTKFPTPFAFPLLIERLRNTLSNESIEKRVEKLIKKYDS